MKLISFLITLSVSIGLSASVSAAPNIVAVDAANKVTNERSEQTRQANEITACGDRKLILLLDHGPRAETTPWLNQQRRLRFDAHKKACMEKAMQLR